MKVRFLFILSFLSVVVSLSAQNFMFKHLEVADGLSNNSVYAILKDKDGFMWFGTASGLNRYDGYRFKVYRHLAEDSTSIPDNNVIGLMDAPDFLWVRLSTGYALFDKTKDRFNRNLEEFMRSIGSKMKGPEYVYVDSLENTWLSVPSEGFYRVSKDRQVQFRSLHALKLPDYGVNAIAECCDGILLLYASGRMVCLDSSDMKIRWIKDDIEKQVKDRTARFSLFVDKDNCVWISCVSGLWAYDVEAGRWLADLVEPWRNQSDFVHSVSQDRQGRIWIGKDYGGIDVLDKKTRKVINVANNVKNPRSLSHNTVYALYADRNGVMWVGTYKKGVSMYGESMFKFNMHEVGDVTCIEQMDNERLWLGTNDRGLILWNRNTGLAEKSYNLGCPVVSLQKSSDGRLWIGTFNGGLYCMEHGRLLHYTMSDGLLNKSVWALETEGSRLWLGFLEGGLQYIDLKRNELHTYKQIEDMVSSLDVTEDDELAVGMLGGTALIDLQNPDKCYRVGSDDKIERGGTDKYEVNQVYSDSRGLIWIATRGNLKVYDKKAHSVKVFPDITGVSGEIISGITEDRNHDMWISSTRQMVHLKFSGDSRRGYVFEPRVYNEKDGLQNCDFNLRAIRTLQDGTIVAGGLYGLNVFNPDEMRYNKVLSKVMFSSLYLFDKEVKTGEKYDGRVILPGDLNRFRKIELDYDQNIFTVEFASDNFNLPDKTTYQYNLKGLGDGWLVLPAGINRVTFTSLAPGTYTLNVKATNSDGYEGTDVARLTIVVHPPFWLAWWAWLCYAFVFVSLLFLARRHILRREREKYRMQQIEHEAAKNEEVNQMKFRFFTNISHELRTPLTLIIAPLEELLAQEKDESRKSVLTLMYRNARRLLMLVNQLLDFRKGEMSGHQLSLAEGDIVSYVREVCNSFLLMADKKHIRFSFFSGVESFSMAFDVDKVGKVMMNLLSNAFKYTPDGGRVTVIMERIEGEKEMMEIKVSDTGIGIPDADKEHVFERFYQTDHKSMEETTGSGIGLSLVCDFVRLHEGTVEVFDNIGTGTVFVVRIPVRHVDVMAELPKPVVGQSDADSVSEQVVEQTDRSNFPLLLVVDDNEDFRMFMKHSLELQYRVDVALNGEEAWL